MNFSRLLEPPGIQDCDPPAQTPRAKEKVTLPQSPTGGPPEDTGYVSHPGAVPQEVLEQEAARKKFEKSEPSGDNCGVPNARVVRTRKGASGPDSDVRPLDVGTWLSRDSFPRVLDYFGKEPIINSLLKLPEGEKVIKSLFDQSKRIPLYIHLEPFQIKLVKKLRDGKNWLISMPPPARGELQLVVIIAEIARWRIDKTEDTKTVIMVNSTARGQKILSLFQELCFSRTEFLLSTTTKRSWKRLMKSVDVLIIMTNALLGFLTVGSGNLEGLDILVVDECENAHSMELPNQLLGLLKKEKLPSNSQPQIIGMTTKNPDAKGGVNLRELRKNLSVADNRVLILNRKGGNRWTYNEHC